MRTILNEEGKRQRKNKAPLLNPPFGQIFDWGSILGGVFLWKQNGRQPEKAEKKA